MIIIIALANTIILLLLLRAVREILRALNTTSEPIEQQEQIKFIEKKSNDIETTSNMLDNASYSEPNTFDAYSANSSFSKLIKG